MAAIVAGAVLGMLAKKGIPHRVEESLTRIQGLAVGLIGLNGVIASMFTVDADGGISDSGGLLLLVSLGWQLVRINRQVETAQAQKEELAEQVESQQAENDALRADIADGGSQEKKEEIARDELGMVAPGERVFVVN